MVFLAIMYLDMVLSRRACARMMRSILALHPYSPVTREQGESTMRSEMMTFSTLDPRMSLTFLHRPSKAAFGGAGQCLALVVLELLDGVLVNGVDQVDNL